MTTPNAADAVQIWRQYRHRLVSKILYCFIHAARKPAEVRSFPQQSFARLRHAKNSLHQAQYPQARLSEVRRSMLRGARYTSIRSAHLAYAASKSADPSTDLLAMAGMHWPIQRLLGPGIAPQHARTLGIACGRRCAEAAGSPSHK